MTPPTIGSPEAEVLGKAMRALLATAFSPDNFGPFLEKSLRIMQDSGLAGRSAKLAVVLKQGRVRSAFRGFGAADRALLEAGKKPAGARAGLYYSETLRLANAPAGRLTALLRGQPESRLAVQSLLGLAAQFIAARLQAELRDEELAFERDLSASVKHIEELYLSFPDISIEEISRAVLDEARRLTGSDLALAGRLPEQGGSLRLTAFTPEAFTVPPPPGAAVELPTDLGLIGHVIRKKKPLISNDVPADRRASRKGTFTGIRRFLGVPALVGRKLVGVLSLANPRGGYSARDVETLDKLARVYAMILQRKAAEDARREEDSRFRTILASTRDVVYTVGLDGRILYVSPRCADYGYEPEELAGVHVTSLAHPDDKEFLSKAFVNALRTGTTLPILPYRLRRKDGSYSYVEQKSGFVVKDGRPAYITGIVRDVTEQRRTEALLKESEALMRMVFDTAEDGMFIKDMNGMYVRVNRAFADRFGLQPADILGRRDSELYSAGDAAEIFREDSAVVRNGRTATVTRMRKLKSGTYYFHTIKTPLRGLKGEVIGLLGVSRDVTAFRKLEGELALARAAKAVSEVARPMAHDFNNALAAINGYATLIDDDLPASSPIKPEISRIVEAVKRAAELTSKFQDFARNPKIEGPGDAAPGKEEKK